jgi:nucleoside-diphosphate-sugar epimerase
MVMRGDSPEPVNLGSNELVSINKLVSIVESIAGVSLERRYNLDAPKGVRGRNSNNDLIEQRYGWSPGISLLEGLQQTYTWILEELQRQTIVIGAT